MTKLELGDKVYRFINGEYDGRIYKIVEVDDEHYGIIPTECKINGQVPTIENTIVEKYPLSQESFVIGVGTISIHKATPELAGQVNEYNTRMLVADFICDKLSITDRCRDVTKDRLLKKTTAQLSAIFLILVSEANGKQGICYVNDKGLIVSNLFEKDELINKVKEPKID